MVHRHQEKIKINFLTQFIFYRNAVVTFTHIFACFRIEERRENSITGDPNGLTFLHVAKTRDWTYNAIRDCPKRFTIISPNL